MVTVWQGLTATSNGFWTMTWIVQREFPAMGHVIRNPAARRRWLVAYVAATATYAT